MSKENPIVFKSPQYVYTGAVHRVLPKKTYGDFHAQSLITTNNHPAYPQFLKFDALNQQTKLLSPLNVGDIVEITFTPKGKDAGHNFFIQFHLKDLSVITKNPNPPPVIPDPPAIANDDDDNDLPF